MASKCMSEVFYFQNRNTGRMVDVMYRDLFEQLINDDAWEKTTQEKFEEVRYGKVRNMKD